MGAILQYTPLDNKRGVNRVDNLVIYKGCTDQEV